jgi:hypothetical protein
MIRPVAGMARFWRCWLLVAHPKRKIARLPVGWVSQMNVASGRVSSRRRRTFAMPTATARGSSATPIPLSSQRSRRGLQSACARER